MVVLDELVVRRAKGCAMPQDDNPNPLKATPRRKALLVAIDDYNGLATNLPSCVNDAMAMSNLLADAYGYEVVHLLNADATLNGVRDAIKSLCVGATEDDRLLFYYSGHGTTIPRVNHVEECLYLADGSFLPDDDFVSAFRQVPPGTVTVCLDSCFSGGMSKAVGLGLPRRIKGVSVVAPDAHAPMQKSLRYRPFGGTARPRYGRFQAARKNPLIASDEATGDTLNALLLTACLETETADASTPATDGLSAFTYAMLSTLSSRGDAISVAELVSEATAELRRIGSIQTPQVKEPAQPALMADRTFPMLNAKGIAKAVGANSALRAKLMAAQPSYEPDSITMEPLVSALSSAIAKLNMTNPY
jgi:uncharacterized caspase-like protein